MTSLRNTKSGLAKLLAGENISVEHKKVRTASFDVKNRILTLPIYKENIEPCVYDTFVAHEVGHALFTPADGIEEFYADREFFQYINIVEDIRIEKLIKNKFAGLTKSFYNGYQQLVRDDFFGIKKISIPDLSFGDRLNINAKTGIDGEFNEEEQTLVDRAKKALTFSEVVEIAKAIKEYEDKMEEEEETSEDEEPGKGESEDDQNEEEGESEKETESTNSPSKKKGKKNPSENGQEEDREGKSSKGTDNSEEQKKSSETKDSEDNSDGDSEEESKKDSTSSSNTKKKRSRESVTQDNSESNYEEFLDKTAQDNYYLTLADFDINSIIIDNKKVIEDLNSYFSGSDNNNSDFIEFKTKNQSIVNYLHKEFEMKKNAEEYKRGSIANSGVLDTTRMFRYKYDDNIFKKISIAPEGKSHGLVMLLDWSGSMSNKIVSTVKQLINLVLFCKRAGIDFEVYAFVTDNSRTDISSGIYKNLTSNQILLSEGFSLINFVSSKLNGQKLNDSLLNLWKLAKIGSRGYDYGRSSYELPNVYRLGNTPLNSALLAAPKLIEKFRSTYKSQIVHLVTLTDGSATDTVRYTSNVSGSDIHAKRINPKSFIKVGSKYYPTRLDPPKTNGYYPSSSSFSVTNALVEFVKESVGVKAVGFSLVTNNSEFSSAFNGSKTLKNPGKWETEFAEFKKNGSLTRINVGYDELYIIKADRKSFDIENPGSESSNTSNIDIKEAMKEVKKDFREIGNSIKKQRIVLNKFITLISNPKENF